MLTNQPIYGDCSYCWSYAQEIATENMTDRGEEVTSEARDTEARGILTYDLECEHHEADRGR